MREIVFDTETTGFEPGEGHRVVEIGCIELDNHMPTGRSYHTYINPERDMPSGAFEVHGLSEEFLSDKPLFADVAQAFLDFVGDAHLVAHNAPFDMKFINFELGRTGRQIIGNDRVIDTLVMAREKFPGAQASLDALCRRFDVDNSARTKHGALLDAELLAEVYLELIGGRQPDLVLGAHATAASGGKVDRTFRPARPHAAPAGEQAAWRAFVKGLQEPLWLKADAEPTD